MDAVGCRCMEFEICAVLSLLAVPGFCVPSRRPVGRGVEADGPRGCSPDRYLAGETKRDTI